MTPRPARTADRGFTLVELLIVIVVLGILSGIVALGVARFRSDATTAACRADTATVSTAADAYDASTGAYPTSVDQLVGDGYLKSAPAGTYAFDPAAKSVTRTPACAGGTAAPTTTAAATGTFTSGTGSCVDLANLSGDDQTPVRLAACTGGPGQRWTAPASYPGRITVLGKCLDVSGGNRVNDSRVQLYGCNNTGAQAWTLRPDGTLLNPQSGRCLSTGIPVGSQLVIFDCGTGANQRWSLA